MTAIAARVIPSLRMSSFLRTFALVAASVFALTYQTACSSDDSDDDGGGRGGDSGSSSGGSSNGGTAGSGGGMGDCTQTGCPNDETCTQCMGANGEILNACIPEGVAC